MYFLFFILHFVCASSLFAASGWEKLAEPCGGPSLKGEGVIEGVNVVTGAYLECSIDLVTHGVDPFTVERYYYRSTPNQGIYADLDAPNLLGWYANYDTKIWFGNSCNGFIDEHLALTQKPGSFAHYVKAKGSPIYKPENYLGFMNHSAGILSGQTHLCNSYVERGGSNTFYHHLGDGTIRYFAKKQWAIGDSIFGSPLTWERKPSGNRVIFSGNEFKTMNADGSIVLNWVRYITKEGGSHYTIETSDNRSFVCFPTQPLQRVPGMSTFLLKQIVMPDGNAVVYHYQDHPMRGNDFFVGKDLPDGRSLRIEYNKKLLDWRVKVLYEPIGCDQTLLPKYRFHYESSYTDVWDALGNKTRYVYDANKRIIQIIRFDADTPCQIEENVWNAEGSLQVKCLKDGEGNIVLARQFFYDNHANVVCEKIFGNLTSTSRVPVQIDPTGFPLENGCDCYTKTYTYSNDRFNLLCSESDGIAVTEYTYYPNTNLLCSKLIRDNEKICLRQFRRYDVLGALCELIEDDGSSVDSADMTGCTLRKILSFHNKMDFPGVGQPEVMEEKYIDFNQNKEIVVKQTHFHYDSHNDCIREDVFDGAGTHLYCIHRRFDAMGRCVSETDPEGHTIQRVFDGNGNILEQRGPRPDIVTKNKYDFSNRLIWTQTEDGYGTVSTKRYRYDLCGNRVSQMDGAGNETLYAFDVLNREIQIIYPPVLDAQDHTICHQVHKRYDVCGNPIEWIDENLDTIFTEYNIRGQPYHIIHKETGCEEHYTYDLRGNLTKKISPDGSYTLFSYDYLDRLLMTEHFDASDHLLVSTSNTYSAFALTSTTDGMGVITTIDYDFTGREKTLTSGRRCTEKAHGPLGFIESIKEWCGEAPDAYTIRYFTCDCLGRVLEESVADAAGNIFFKQRRCYDACGNCTKKIEFFSETCFAETDYIYDAFGREIERQDPYGATFCTLYKEAVFDGLCGIGPYKLEIDPLGNQVESSFDARANLIRQVTKNGSGDILSHKQFRYDGKGNRTILRQEIAPSQWQEVQTRYAASGKPIEIVEKNSQNCTRMHYDLKGQLIRKETPLCEHLFQYDPLGNVICHIALSGSEKSETHYTYDKCGRALCIKQNGRKTLREYDVNGNLLSERQQSGLTVKYAYDRQMRRTVMALPDGTSVSYRYKGPFLYQVERNNFCFTYLQRDLSGNPVATDQCSIRYDLIGRIQSIQAHTWRQKADYDLAGNLSLLTTFDGPIESVCCYAYDGLGQVTSENDISFKYDFLGNPSDADVGPCNQLLKDTKNTFAYDLEGRLVQSETYSCAYDALGRMTQYNQTHYTYDGLGRRISKDCDIFLYDGNREIGKYDADGNLSEFRLLGEGRGAELSATLSIEIDHTPFFVVNDVRENIGALFDKSGCMIESYHYAAFGQLSSSSAVGNPWNFQSKRQDPESGWIFFGRRYYAPLQGRFTTPDPVGYRDHLNLYLFAYNNPLTHTDLYGYYEDEGPVGSRHLLDFLGSAFRFAMHIVEWIGKNLIPLPGVRDCVESIGRWGAGGDLLTLAEYRESRCQIHTIHGAKVDNVTTIWVNGVRNTLEEAIQSATDLSQHYGGIEVIILYNSTHGLITDLIECAVFKLGGLCMPEKLIIDFVRETLHNSPDETIHIHAHSQGGLHLYNAARRLSEDERTHIECNTYGSAKIIPALMFEKVINYLSYIDMVPIFDTINYLKALTGNAEHVIFLSPNSYNPFKEHMILEKTYRAQMSANGDKFQKRYL